MSLKESSHLVEEGQEREVQMQNRVKSLELQIQSLTERDHEVSLHCSAAVVLIDSSTDCICSALFILVATQSTLHSHSPMDTHIHKLMFSQARRQPGARVRCLAQGYPNTPLGRAGDKPATFHFARQPENTLSPMIVSITPNTIYP